MTSMGARLGTSGVVLVSVAPGTLLMRTDPRRPTGRAVTVCTPLLLIRISCMDQHEVTAGRFRAAGRAATVLLIVPVEVGPVLTVVVSASIPKTGKLPLIVGRGGVSNSRTTALKDRSRNSRHQHSADSSYGNQESKHVVNSIG